MPSKKPRLKPVRSKYISDFCAMVDEIQKDFAWNVSEVNRLDKLTQDYLHVLELQDTNYKKRASLATKLANCRRERRESKDTIEILEPLIAFLESEKGKNMMNLMREALGKMRKVEERMKNRSYRFRVLDTETDQSN